MFPSGAPTSTSTKHQGVLGLLAVVAVCLVAASAAFATAQLPPPAASQGTPSIALDSFTYEVGDTLHLSGQNLEPNATYTVSLVPPEGSSEEERTLEVSTDVRGGLRVDALLRNAGSYTVSLSGPRIDARLTVQVGANEQGGAAQEDGAQEGARQEDEPQDGAAQEEGAQEDDAQEDGAQDDAAPGAEPQQPEGADEQPEPGAEEAPAAGSARPDVAIVGDAVVAEVDGEEAWRLDFGSSSGGTDGLLQRDGTVLVGHGNHVLEIDAATGTVTRRDRLPAKVGAIEASNGEVVGGVTVTVRYASGATELLPWPPDETATHAFDTDPELFGWLEREADVRDPVAQLAKDPTNPWLYLAAAEEQPQRLIALRRNALARAQTFYEYGRLANAFLAQPNRDLELAAQTMDAALDDFVARGYRGSLLFDEAASAAYGFPASSLRDALERSDDEAVDFWAPWLYRLTSDAAPTSNTLLAAYADDLRSRARAEEAATWDERARGGQRFEIRSTLQRAARALGSTGWYGVIALLVAILALHLTLAAKYWRAQTVHLAARAEVGHDPGRTARFFTLRYATITEKLVILLLFAAVLVMAALTGWVRNSDDLPAGLGFGSLASVTSQETIEQSLPPGPERAYLLGYAAQTAGDEERATALYRELSEDADAMNNLGVLRGDDELYRLALELEPRHPEASYNLGLVEEHPSRLLAAYRPGEPLLAAPARGELRRASGGNYLAALGAAFTNPWTTLTQLRALSPQWLWIALVVLFLVWVAWTIITLLIPRPASARNAPRTLLYHVLALLLPGSGLADELWGILLLVPWAIFGIDTLIHFFAFSAEPTFPLRTDLIVLAVIYLLNIVAFIVESVSYRRRMRELKREAALPRREYGLSDLDT